MKGIKYTILFLCLMILICVIFWSLKSPSAIIENSHYEGITALNFTQEVNGLNSTKGKEAVNQHLINAEATLQKRKEVEKVMKPWQTIQIFRPNVDPMDMRFSRIFRYFQTSTQTDWIKQRVKSCAVVGNSGILLGSNCGHVIDSMDLIIRMNLAEFGHGYSSDVGSKVTFMTINREQLRQVLACFLNMTKDAKEVPLQNTTTQVLPRECDNLIKRLRMLKDDVLWLFKGRLPGLQEVLLVLRKKFDLNFKFAYSPVDPISPSRRLWKFRAPTSGLAMYAAATQLCDEISLFGFYPFYTDKYNRTILHHYYEPELKDFKVHHNMPEEHKFFLELENKGALRLVNNCSSIRER